MSSDATFRWAGLAAGAFAGALALAVVRRLLARRALARVRRGQAHPDGGDAAAPDGARAVVRSRRLPAARARLPVVPRGRGARPATRSCCSRARPQPITRPSIMFVDTSAPAGSRLLSKRSGNGHEGGAVYAAGSPEYDTILAVDSARSTAMNRSLNFLATRACLAAVALAVAGRSAVLSSRATPARPSSSPGPRSSRPDRTPSALAQTIAISVTTKDGEDASYTFTSADPTIATVDGAGVVTGVAPGETSVTITGDDSLATADYPVAVVAERRDADPLLRRLDDVGARRRDGARRSTTGTRTARSRPPAPAATARRGSSTTSGGDGSAAGVVDKPAPTKSVIRCVTCHNPAADALSSVTFPSGVTVDGLGGEARCMTCHQGRSRARPSTPRSPRPPPATRRHRQRRRSTSRTSTTSRPPPRCSRGAPRAATSTPVRSTTSASATSTATTPASAATTRTRRGSSSTPAPAATPGSRTSAARTRSG